MLTLAITLHNGVRLLVIGRVPMNHIRKCLVVIDLWISMLSEDCIDNII
jgi:hypothetical protein